MIRLRYLCSIVSALLFVQCQQAKEKPLFRVVSAEETGVDFENTISPTPELNIFTYMYFYNGGGVGAGDLNGDGRPDLVFTSNLGENKVYLNEGNWKFRDVTKESGFFSDQGWSNGVSLVDVNQDGKLDIYISQVGDFLKFKGHNLLFVCESIDGGVPKYRERSKEYGLDLVGFGTQALFFDADLDGDLDLFQLNHSVHENGTFGKREVFLGQYHPLAGDRYLENVNGKYVDQTKESGIHSNALGYGLGVVAGDVNFDGLPDLYVGNDFHENDYLYINQGKGIFRDEIETRMQHTSRFSMGVDLADLTDDARPEIISLDMLPYDPAILKRSEGEDAYYNFKYKLQQGYNVQFARNNLQLNRGNGHFAEVGLLAGIHATDWSWSSLFFDVDQDGQRDLFISNGINKRMNDIDYINFVSNEEIQTKIDQGKFDENDVSLVDLLPEVKIPNKLFRRTQGLRFEEVTQRIADQEVSYSNGAVYADLDGDGDLDLVTNNINAPAFLYENVAEKRGNSLVFDLIGAEGNRQAIGAKVLVYQQEKVRSAEQFPVRGFQSSSIGPLIVGVGREVVDSVQIIWPDGTFETLRSPKQLQFKVSYRTGLPSFKYPKEVSEGPIRDITAEVGLSFLHRENAFNEFDREALMPNMLSTAGPVVAVADFTGDGREDFFVGSSKWEKSRLFSQTPDGRFKEFPAPKLWQDSTFEDTDAKWVDVNRDGKLDLVVASGGNEFFGKTAQLAPRVYVQKSDGQFERKEDAFSGVYATASVVVPLDANGDGAIDLFLGARGEAFAYGIIPRSYLLINDGTGRFKAKEDAILDRIGMVKDAQWVTWKPGRSSLVVALEWGGIVEVEITSGKATKKTDLLGTTGWWNIVRPMDMDGDGDLDLFVGNLGENSRLKASPTEPVRMYVADYDGNGRVEQVLTYYLQGKEVLFADKREVEKQLPYVKKAYTFAKDFSEADFRDIFGRDKVETALQYEAKEMRSGWLRQSTEGKFEWEPLGDAWQMSSYQAIARLGQNTWLVGGNFFDCNIQMGQYDADQGSLMVRGKDGVFRRKDLQLEKGQIRGLYPIQRKGETVYLVAVNQGPLRIWK